ncbi:MAG: hypothetical protein R6U62_09170, partial [Bacteroidales bacterium]
MNKPLSLRSVLMSCCLLLAINTISNGDSLPQFMDNGDNDMDYYYEITMEAADLVPEHMDSARQLLERSSV